MIARGSVRDEAARGQSLVEFALILPIFIVVLLGIFDGGRLVFAYNTVNNAAREAGREATVNQTETDIQARGAAHAVALDVPPWAVQVSYLPTTTTPCVLGQPQITTCLAVIQVTYDYSAATPIIGALVGPITVTGEVRFPVEFNCVDGGVVDCPLGQ